MKHLATTLLVLTATALPVALQLCAAVPLRWSVETSRLQPVAFDAVRGETLALEAAFNSYGTALQLPTNAAYALFYQTNGMASAWWQIPAAVSSNRLAAVFAPTNDPGAPVVRAFLGSTGQIFRAAFTLRFRDGPGATPNALAAPVPILDLANTVVVNPPWPTTNDFATATNSMQAALKSYVDKEIQGAGVITPTTVTNIVDDKIAQIPQGGVDTNVVLDLIKPATNAVVAEVAGLYLANRPSGYNIPFLYWNSLGYFTIDAGIQFTSGAIITTHSPGDGLYFHENNEDYASILKPDGSQVQTKTTADAAYAPISTAVTVATHTTQITTLSNDVSAWSTYWDGDDVRVTVTNYDSTANIPSLYLEQRTNTTALATNLFKTVWREMAHWEAFLGTNWNWRSATWGGFSSWREALEAEVDEKADRAWGFYDSATGDYAPAGYTSISSTNIMIASNMSYQKTVTTSGEVWVLTANEPYEPTGVSTNGGFQLRDSDGNVQFEIIKGDKVTVAAQAHGVTVDTTTTPNTLVVTYNIIAAEHPTGSVCLDLATANWKGETAADCPATVTWSGSSGAYVARIQPGAATSKCFFKATYQRGGSTYVNHRTAVGMSQIVLNGTLYNLGTATIDGNTVLTLTPAN